MIIVLVFRQWEVEYGEMIAGYSPAAFPFLISVMLMQVGQPWSVP